MLYNTITTLIISDHLWGWLASFVDKLNVASCKPSNEARKRWKDVRISPNGPCLIWKCRCATRLGLSENRKKKAYSLEIRFKFSRLSVWHRFRLLANARLRSHFVRRNLSPVLSHMAVSVGSECLFLFIHICRCFVSVVLHRQNFRTSWKCYLTSFYVVQASILVFSLVKCKSWLSTWIAQEVDGSSLFHHQRWKSYYLFLSSHHHYHQHLQTHNIK